MSFMCWLFGHKMQRKTDPEQKSLCVRCYPFRELKRYQPPRYLL